MWSLLAICGTDSMAYAVVLPIVPFAVKAAGGSFLATAAVFAAFSLCQLWAAPLLGRISGSLGRKPVLVGSQIGSLAGFLLLAVAGSWPVMLLARAVDGATAGNMAVVLATVCDLEEPERRVANFAAINTASAAGLLVGLGICALLAGTSFSGVALVATAICAFSIGVCAVAAFPPPKGGVEHVLLRTYFRRRGAPGRTAGALVAVQVAFGATAATLPAFLHYSVGVSVRVAVGAMAGALVVGGAIAQLVARSCGDAVAVRGGCVLIAAGAAGLGLAGVHVPQGLVLAVGGAVALATGLILGVSGATALLGRSLSGADPGVPMGLSQSAASIGQLLGPAVGFALMAFSPPALCVLIGVAAAVAVLVLGTPQASEAAVTP